MNIGFDYDGCLGHVPQLQTLCKTYVAAGFNVSILTYRDHMSIGNTEMYALAESLGIRKEDVHLCASIDKKKHVKTLDLDVYYDDDKFTVHTINSDESHKCHAILMGYTYSTEDHI